MYQIKVKILGLKIGIPQFVKVFGRMQGILQTNLPTCQILHH